MQSHRALLLIISLIMEFNSYEICMTFDEDLNFPPTTLKLKSLGCLYMVPMSRSTYPHAMMIIALTKHKSNPNYLFTPITNMH